MATHYNKIVDDLGNIVDAIAYYEKELEDARWFNIKELPIIPPNASISGQLIRFYIEDHLKLS